MPSWGGLPVRDLSLHSENGLSEISFRFPSGYGDGGSADLLLITSRGRGFVWPDFADGFNITLTGEAFTATTATLPLPVNGGSGKVPGLKHASGTVMVSEIALARMGATPFRIPEIGRTYWTLDGYTGDVTAGSAVAWVEGRQLLLPLPVQAVDGIIYVPLRFLEELAAAGNGGFRDVAGHWAREEIVRLAGLGVVSGYGDGTFRPDASLTQAAFVKMLAAARGLEPRPGDTGGFSDAGARLAVGGRVFLHVAAWSRPGHVIMAVEAGIVRGYPEAGGGYTFRPAGSASRAEAAAMVVRMLDSGAGR